MRVPTMIGHPGSGPVVAHLISPAGLYGAERWVLTLARYLGRCHVPVLLVTIGDSQGAVTVHECFRRDHGDAVHIPAGGKISLAAVATLRRLLNARGVQVVHTHGFKSDVLGYLATRGSRCALVSTPHGWSSNEGWRLAAYEMIGRACMRRFDKVYPLSRPLEADLLQRGFRRNRVDFIPNAVDDEPLRPIFLERQVEGFPLRGTVVFVGRLVLSKGVVDLVEGFAQATLPAGTQLAIAGEGPALDLLRRRSDELGIANRVSFMGYVSDVRMVLRNADLLVLPSYSEGLPRSLMEAAAAGVPIVSTDIAGVRELLTHEYSALLVPSRDSRRLAAALERMYGDHESRVRMAHRARRTIEERHTGARQASAFAAAYTELSSERRASLGSRRSHERAAVSLE